MDTSPRPLPSGPDNGRAPIQPVHPSTNCNCAQCALTRIFTRLIDVAMAPGLPLGVEDQICAICAALHDIILKGIDK